MTNIQAAIGLAQLEKLDDAIKRKIRIGNLYDKYLKGINEIQLPLKSTHHSTNHYWVYGILLKTNHLILQKN